MPDRLTHCACGCGTQIEQPARGRPRRWVSDAHRKNYERSLAELPADLKPLPDPPPIPQLSMAERLVLALADIRAGERELTIVGPKLESTLSWRCAELAECIARDRERLFGGVL
jgi:hypothetical protein